MAYRRSEPAPFRSTLVTDAPIQRALEERMDADFSNVRIHTGAKAAEAADAIDAKAFTCGNDVVFNAGEYGPDSVEGPLFGGDHLEVVGQLVGGRLVGRIQNRRPIFEVGCSPYTRTSVRSASRLDRA